MPLVFAVVQAVKLVEDPLPLRVRDPDPLVLDAARNAGYDVLPADWMPAVETLREAQEVEGET